MNISTECLPIEKAHFKHATNTKNKISRDVVKMLYVI